MAKLVFITHPEVEIAPERPVPDWGLSNRGQARAEAFATDPCLSDVTELWSSTERKAIEAAKILARIKALPVRQHTGLGENDRSATGFLPSDAFEAAADAFFAEPHASYCGWERAVDAQKRIVDAVQSILKGHESGDLAIVAHGAVGTLLWCHLSGLPIDRRHDQPSQGHYWYAELPDLNPDTGWISMG